jgi:hypothetical protein
MNLCIGIRKDKDIESTMTTNQLKWVNELFTVLAFDIPVYVRWFAADRFTAL